MAMHFLHDCMMGYGVIWGISDANARRPFGYTEDLLSICPDNFGIRGGWVQTQPVLYSSGGRVEVYKQTTRTV